jgi:D-proline reductase (dithiol) PrdB
VSLVARYLEEHGMPTVLIGSAQDIVEHCAVPRFLFVDFPLGNPCGKPWDDAMQERIVRQGLSLFETVTQPMTTVVSMEQWGDDGWRQRYLEVTAENRAALAAKGEDLRKSRQQRVRRSE